MKCLEQEIPGVSRPLLCRDCHGSELLRTRRHPVLRVRHCGNPCLVRCAGSPGCTVPGKAGVTGSLRIREKPGYSLHLPGNPVIRDLAGVLVARFRGNPCFAGECDTRIAGRVSNAVICLVHGSVPVPGLRTGGLLAGGSPGRPGSSKPNSIIRWIQRAPLAEPRVIIPHLQIAAQGPAERAAARAPWCCVSTCKLRGDIFIYADT